jgi:hypothetical protein
MPEDDFQEILTTTLRKIGRNLFNYQVVEKYWKSHINLSSILTSSETNLAEYPNADAIRRSIPMGWLADNHTKSLFIPKPEADSELNEDDDFSVYFSFAINRDDEGRKARRRQVRTLIEDRNKLVHSLVDRFNCSDRNSCLSLCTQLDEEHERIIAELQYLRSISAAIKEGMMTVKNVLLSDEFCDELLNLKSE